MKILFICHRFPFPPKRGGKIRPFNIIRHFARHHDVTVYSLVRSAQEGEEGEGLGEHCKRYEMVRVADPFQVLRMVARLPSPIPSSFGYFYSAQLKRRIDAALAREHFDLIFVHCSSMARYVEQVTDIPKILDFGDMDSQKWHEYARVQHAPLAWGYALEAAKLEREEARLARHYDVSTVTTRAEWETLDGMQTGAATDWFPNGVDSEYFAPSAQSYEADRLVFVGKMDYYPNQAAMQSFCRDVMPALRAKRPSIRLSIVGADPPHAIKKLGELPGVDVTGSVPDVRPYMHDAALMVAPLTIARGTQNKILEGMAAGVPVVSSRIAAGGVDAIAPEHFLVAATPTEYVEAIMRVLDDRTERERLASAGRARMLSHHAWPQSMHRLEGIVERCILDARSPRSLALT